MSRLMKKLKMEEGEANHKGESPKAGKKNKRVDDASSDITHWEDHRDDDGDDDGGVQDSWETLAEEVMIFKKKFP